MSFRQLIQSCIGFISFLCFIGGKREGSTFCKTFFAVFRNSMNVIANAKKLFEFFVIDGKGEGRYPRDTLKCKKGGTHLRAIDWYQMGGGSGLRLVLRSGLTLVVGRHVTIGRVLFSDPIAFVDTVISRTYFNHMIFCFTWIWIVLNETSKK
jgi:hypothetical protein